MTDVIRQDDGRLYRVVGRKLKLATHCELCEAHWDEDEFTETCRRCKAVAKSLGLLRRKSPKRDKKDRASQKML